MNVPMSSPNPRKRPAPGSAPATMPQHQQQTYYPPTSTPDPMNGWNGNNVNSFMDNSSNNLNPFSMLSPPTQAPFNSNTTPGGTTPSTALARRGNNNQLVVTNHNFNTQQNDVWAYGDENLVSGSGFRCLFLSVLVFIPYYASAFQRKE